MNKIIVAYGTRPELIKLVPVISLLRKNKNIELLVLSTGQHKEMVEELEVFFKITPDICFHVMKHNQTLNHILADIVSKFNDLIDTFKPSAVIVQGDTTTVLSIGLASFYKQIPVAHVEAGLRSFDIYNPYPEEVNRKIISLFATWNFAPTTASAKNLLKEGVAKNKIHITGNTVVDTMQFALKSIKADKKNNVPTILVTAHRRENHGEGIKKICNAILTIKKKHPTINFVWPVHPNPNVKNIAHQMLGNIAGIKLLEPLPYAALLKEMKNCTIIWSDSGGIQEEAPTIKKPVLVLRDVTERPEVIKAGFGKLVGTNPTQIIKETEKLLNNKKHYSKMISGKNPFGNGKAANKIISILLKK